ncbi:MAG: YopX family protein [Loigolactobacillus coryniformis]|uniref:YopX family protein n=1 Tax=Loigolactobacillus coryniformis TaxID=1610 RepID=UPI00264867FF|nr:YopX family protein [Loigolactobacillus coryniformis]MDN5950948.1 YopX family protein [Loigolactobacillus coryniformis]MDN5954239.1 YopX family protein [Loigolactobacillus coryniformis]
MATMIKFRAWDNECKVIREYDELKGLTLDALDASHFELEQFTGLKDINGRKIFEGDIITVQATNDDGSTDGMLGRIDYDADIASFGFAVIGGDNWDNHSFDNLFEEGFVDLHVIGNVYENPELLEEEK